MSDENLETPAVNERENQEQPSTETQVILSAEDHAALQEAKKAQDDLAAEAAEYGFEDSKGYVDHLLNLATTEPVKAAPKPAPKGEVKDVVPPVKTEADKTAEKAMQQAQVATQAADQARFESQWGTFNREQDRLPEGERSKLDRAELEKFMRTPRGYNHVSNLVQAGEYDGNPYAAAADLLDLENMKKTAKAQGFKAGQTMKGAADTASISTGSIPAPSSNKEVSNDQKLALLVAPKAGVFEG